MDNVKDFNALLWHLKCAGISVGQLERKRIQAAILNCASMDWEVFQDILISLLAKNADQVEVIQRYCQDWFTETKFVLEILRPQQILRVNNNTDVTYQGRRKSSMHIEKAVDHTQDEPITNINDKFSTTKKHHKNTSFLRILAIIVASLSIVTSVSWFSVDYWPKWMLVPIEEPSSKKEKEASVGNNQQAKTTSNSLIHKDPTIQHSGNEFNTTNNQNIAPTNSKANDAPGFSLIYIALSCSLFTVVLVLVLKKHLTTRRIFQRKDAPHFAENEKYIDDQIQTESVENRSVNVINAKKHNKTPLFFNILNTTVLVGLCIMVFITWIYNEDSPELKNSPTQSNQNTTLEESSAPRHSTKIQSHDDVSDTIAKAATNSNKNNIDDVTDPTFIYFFLFSALFVIALVFATMLYLTSKRVPLPTGFTRPPKKTHLMRLLPRSLDGPELLTIQDMRNAVWRIDHFVSEDATQSLDLRMTVNATAKAGGLPELRHCKAVYPREVWLWADLQTRSSIMKNLIGEITKSLQNNSLPVQTGWFTGVPDTLYSSQGQKLYTSSLDGHRRQVIVLFFTDGRGLRQADASNVELMQRDRLLASLAQWPQLAFVEVGDGQEGMVPLLKDRGINCITPENIPQFLGMQQTDTTPARKEALSLTGPLIQWVGAAALCPDAIKRNDAQALRQALKLQLEPLDIRSFTRIGETIGDAVNFSPEVRKRALNELVQSELLQPDKPVPGRSRLGRALTFWQSRNADHRRHCMEMSGGQAEVNSEEELRLRMEEAFLELWIYPNSATKTLYRIYRTEGLTDFRLEIEERLALLYPAPSDLMEVWQGEYIEQYIYLPWSECRLKPDVRVMLHKMRFAGGQFNPRPQWSMKRSVLVVILVIFIATAPFSVWLYLTSL